MKPDRAGTWALYPALLAATFLLSLWLRQAFPIFAIGFAGHDDRLFIRLAVSLSAGQWLGPYDNLTMAKGMAYSFFMALNHLSGLPLKLGEHLVYLAVSLYFSLTSATLFRSRPAALVCFAILAFNPVLWNNWVGGRVVRENLYISLSLLLLTTAIRAFVIDRQSRLSADLRAKLPLLTGMGLTAGAYWLTREEGIWLLPAILVLVAGWLGQRWREVRASRAGLAQGLAFLIMPVAACAIVVGMVNATNYLNYGVFRNNDFRSADFQAAYGALARIRHDRHVPYVVFPKDARAKAYAVSPAARELQPFLDGEAAELWRRAGCEQTATAFCPEILSGWFMWALRDAVAFAGHYRNATQASAYYRRLAHEINAACARGEIPCGPPNASLVPFWQPSFLDATLRAARAIFNRLMTLDSSGPGLPGGASIQPSLGSAIELEPFDRITNGPLASSRHLCTDIEATTTPNGFCTRTNMFRLALTRHIDTLQSKLTRLALPTAALLWLAFLAHGLITQRWHPGHLVVAALSAAVAARVLLLGFLEATSMPSNNMLYLLPVTPMALALTPCVVFLAIALHGNKRHAD